MVENLEATASQSLVVEVGEELEAAVTRALDVLAEQGISAEEADEFVKECVFNAWFKGDAFADKGECICPPEMRARNDGSFKGGCPVHG